MAPGAWTTEDKFNLLLAILKLQNAPIPPWETVAQEMGGDKTWNACRQAYQKIRKTAGGDKSAGGDATPTKSSPNKSSPTKAASAKKATATPRKRTKAAQADGEDGEDDDETVSKKKVKAEADHESS